MTAHAIGRAGIHVGVLDNEVVMTDPPASLRVTVDFPVAPPEDGQDPEAPGESGPEAVPATGFVVRAGPGQHVVEERIDPVHRSSDVVMDSQVNLSCAVGA